MLRLSSYGQHPIQLQASELISVTSLVIEF
jgi:hypothetical protein